MRGIFRNFFLKLFSLILAVVLWYYANLQNRTLGFALVEKEIRDVPVKVLVNPGEKISFSLSPTTVIIRVRGRRNTVEKMGKEDLFVFVNLEKGEKGIYELPLQWRIPQGVDILNIRPSRVKVRVE